MTLIGRHVCSPCRALSRNRATNLTLEQANPWCQVDDDADADDGDDGDAADAAVAATFHPSPSSRGASAAADAESAGTLVLPVSSTLLQSI